ncbi:MAG: hypothetical protein FJX74_24095 [Armatimonadetes bacterium]|nr:hypothetical protein [Armatimonadota bacterium]
MRWQRVAVVGIGVVAVAAGIAAFVYQDQIRVALALWRCGAAWKRLRDYESDFRLEVRLGPLETTVRGHALYLKPDFYRLELGDPVEPRCVVVKRERTTCVSFPGTDLPLIEAQFPSDADGAAIAGSQSPLPWIEQLAWGGELRWVGQGTVDGRPCSVLELTIPAEVASDGRRMAAPALGSRYADLPFVGEWRRTRVYLDAETALPIRGEALKANGALLFSWTASNVQVDRGLSASDFNLHTTSPRVLKRTYDPAHPERLFLPPGTGRSLLRRLGDVLEDEVKEYLRDEAEEQARDEEAQQPAPE